jgi:nucleotide-binding universal stress UspA family protein
MSYKTILVHVDQSSHAPKRIRLAASLAVKENAHLIGAAATGVSQFIAGSGFAADMGVNLTVQLATQLDVIHHQAQAALKNFEQIVQEFNVRSFETTLINDESGAAISIRGRYSDLVIIGQTDLNEPSPSVPPDFSEYVMMNCSRPVLIIPHTGQYEQIGRKILVAWNESAESSRALTAAIPLLKKADIVELATLIQNPEDTVGGRTGADIALYLARHGIKVNVIAQKAEIDVGNTLLSLACDLNSDLLVMGGYGHSRFREILLGGVTRTIFSSMTLPVLMAH